MESQIGWSFLLIINHLNKKLLFYVSIKVIQQGYCFVKMDTTRQEQPLNYSIPYIFHSKASKTNKELHSNYTAHTEFSFVFLAIFFVKFLVLMVA